MLEGRQSLFIVRPSSAFQNDRQPSESHPRFDDYFLQQERRFPRKTFRPKPPPPHRDGRVHELLSGLLRHEELQGDVQLHPQQVRGRLLQPADHFERERDDSSEVPHRDLQPLHLRHRHRRNPSRFRRRHRSRHAVIDGAMWTCLKTSSIARQKHCSEKTKKFRNI